MIQIDLIPNVKALVREGVSQVCVEFSGEFEPVKEMANNTAQKYGEAFIRFSSNKRVTTNGAERVMVVWFSIALLEEHYGHPQPGSDRLVQPDASDSASALQP